MASISETGHVGAVGGTAVIPAVVNYIEGYAQGARSVNPDVEVLGKQQEALLLRQDM